MLKTTASLGSPEILLCTLYKHGPKKYLKDGIALLILSEHLT